MFNWKAFYYLRDALGLISRPLWFLVILGVVLVTATAIFAIPGYRTRDSSPKKASSITSPKPGYGNEQRKQIEKERWFKNLQKFRAGIEGMISTLMRSYGLTRCIWRDWEAFKRYVTLSVITFNLRKIAVLS